jgi:sigma-B regulation protein RsbU (phosphoserine phosphatase)
MLKIKSLQTRFTLFLILPVGILLVAIGASAFFYARDLLMAQWREASTLKLQRAAHEVDMRLGRIKGWISMFHESSGAQYSESFHAWVLNYLKGQEGVSDVRLIWNGTEHPIEKKVDGRHEEFSSETHQMLSFHSAQIREITAPRFDANGEQGTVSLVSDLTDENDRVIGQLEVDADFNYLFRGVAESGWWQSNQAFLVDAAGQILVGTDPNRQGRLGDNNNPLELKTLAALKTASNGTLFGRGYASQEVSGFQRLHEAPWSLVLIAPGWEILAPVMELQLIYLLVGAGSVVIIITLIRMVTLRTISAIRNVSAAALRLSEGNVKGLLTVQSQDEVGDLTRSFNVMTTQLTELLSMKAAMGLAMEVQQNFLPHRMPSIPELDIAARTLYCDETGGDFYDFIKYSAPKGARFGIMVGDGSGHGISAALLMATVRAALRARAAQPGTLAQVITDVNRLLGSDTEETGYFMTLFYLEVDVTQKVLRWVRAGHEPAMVIDPESASVKKLKGEGMAIGVDAEYIYRENTHPFLKKGQILFIGTDGISETQNASGERFGEERLRNSLKKWSFLPAREITDRVIAALDEFRGNVKQEDDVTLVIVKFLG